MKRFLTMLLFLFLAGTLAALNVGEPAPELSGPDKDGKTLKLSALRGKVVLIEFWASWCAPCRQAMPGTLAKQKQYGPRGFVAFLVGINRRPETDKRFLTHMKYDFPHAIFTGGETGAYEVTGIPHAVLVGRDGKVLCIGHPASLTAAMVEQALR
jgi:thiol-disulfide isomerase/thioredoxin